ncbi:MAG: hypothetical protein D6710_07720 [Nitrospirae bacterium]|nr:MAG: hypothetical protein D6710_07720 [Nitrospirota bacterium]
MSLSCEITTGGKHEVVISEDELCREAHRGLFRFSSENYIVADGDAFKLLKDVLKAGAIKVHLVGSWRWILGFAMGSKELDRGELFYTLKSLGLKEEELVPFRKSDVDDLFHFLYYGKRFEVLRRVCQRAKKKTEQSLNKEGVSIHCHIVSAITNQIVASSL